MNWPRDPRQPRRAKLAGMLGASQPNYGGPEAKAKPVSIQNPYLESLRLLTLAAAGRASQTKPDNMQSFGTSTNSPIKRSTKNILPAYGRLPTDEEIARIQQATCKTPEFRRILNNPSVQATMWEIRKKAQSTRNRGIGGDIPENGSEYGVYVGDGPFGSIRKSEQFTSNRENWVDFRSSKIPSLASNLTAIHTHQSPRGRGYLSGDDLTIARPDGLWPGMNIVAVTPSGQLYCKRKI